jgi:predicted ester cyclase
LVQRFIDEVLNAGNFATLAELTVPGSMFAGGQEGQVQAMRTAFPDLHFTIVDILAEGNKVAVQLSTQGTHTGPLVGLPGFGRLETPIPPTGKTVIGSAINMFTVSDGKIISFASELDQIGLLRQMGWTFTPPGFEKPIDV